MVISDKGVLPPSYMDFSIPSDFARRALYFALQFGHFICDRNYRIDREYLDQYLLVYVESGALHVCSGSSKTIASGGEIILLDCHSPHSYWCEDSVNFYWFHFDGCSSAEYVRFLNERFGIKVSGPRLLSLKDYFRTIIHQSQTTLLSEHQISSSIHTILSGIAGSDKKLTGVSELISPALSYIHNFFAEDIPLDELAKRCGVSKSHFIRLFQRYMGSTPHEYLLLYRLRQAKRLLLSTDLSVEQISDQCGFNSASHFTRAFRSSTGVTPRAFRSDGF